MLDPASSSTFDVELAGCRPEPLASYLKALGVLRLIAEQRDNNATGFWRGEQFVVRSTLDRAALIRFFLDEWQPTPVIAPWNGGSGFYPRDNRVAPDAIVASLNPRLRPFAASIEIGRAFLAVKGWVERPRDEDKLLLISTMRARLPDEALAWLDAAVVLGDDRLLFPPLLGTGGNDGRLDFSNNFQQRIVDILSSSDPARLESALFGVSVTSRYAGVMGQYLPAANQRTNPWDFVLLIEGATMFAAAATRRYESSSPAVLAFPFHARAAGGLATVTDSDENESRDELWVPLWSSPTTLREVRRLFSEGRATVSLGERARPAATALDFARSVTGLGVDRGIHAFCRIGFHVRNGLAYFATPLGRFETGEVREARLLDDVDAWFDRFRQKSSGKNVPARVAVVRRRLEQAMFDAVRTANLGPVLIELGEADRALARSLTFTTKAFLRPVPQLQSSWAAAVADGSLEQRLAAALAARPGMRGRLIPLDRSGREFGRSDDADFVFSDRPLIDNLHALLQREDIEAQQTQRRPAPPSTVARCSLGDIARFIDGEVDDTLVERWLRALVLVDGGMQPDQRFEHALPPASFAVLALVHHRRLGDLELHRTSGVLMRACAGDAIGATGLALRRLAAVARPLPVAALAEPTTRTRRIAAALAFPLTTPQRRALESLVLPTFDASPSTPPDSKQEQA